MENVFALGPENILPLCQWALSFFCSVFLFCSPSVMLLFMPNLPLFPTTNQHSALFVFSTSGCWCSISGLQPFCHIVFSVFLSAPLFAPCYFFGIQTCRRIYRKNGGGSAQSFSEGRVRRQKARCQLSLITCSKKILIILLKPN